MADRAERPGSTPLILAYRNADVQRLNDEVRAERMAAGELGASVTVQRIGPGGGESRRRRPDGALRGRARLLLGPDAERQHAERSLPGLTQWIAYHHKTEPILVRQLEAAAKVPHRLEELSRRIDTVSRALQQARSAARSPEQALEATVRKLGHQAMRAAVTLLPASIQAPVRAAVWALERVLSVSRGMDR